MTYKIEIESVKKEFLPVFEALAKSVKASYKTTTCKSTRKKRESGIDRALRELENGEYESFESFEEYKRAMSNV